METGKSGQASILLAEVLPGSSADGLRGASRPVAGELNKMRIVVVGQQSSHVPQILKYANTSRTRRLEVAAVLPETGDLKKSLAAVPAPLDAVFLASRCTPRRIEQAAVVLSLGMHVYSDKVLADEVETCEELLQLALRQGVSATGGSTLRFTDPVPGLLSRTSSRPFSGSILVGGGADPGSPYGGRSFYAVHSLDLASALAGPDARISEVQWDQEAIRSLLFSGRNARVWVTIHDASPDGSQPFRISATPFYDGPLILGSNYLFPLLDAWHDSLRMGRPLLSAHDNLLLAEALSYLRAPRH